MLILISDVQAKQVFGGQQAYVRQLYSGLKSKGFKVAYLGDDETIKDRLTPFTRSFYLLMRVLYGLLKRPRSKEEDTEKHHFIPRSNRLNMFFERFPSLKKWSIVKHSLHADALISNSALDYLAINEYNDIKYDSLLIIKHDAYFKFGKQYPGELLGNVPFRIIALNKKQTADLSKVYGKRNVEWVSGVDAKIIAHKITNKQKVILSVGRLEEKQKGFALAIKAIKILKEKRQDFIYYIVGDGKDRPMYENMIKEYNLEDKVKLLGFVSAKEKEELLGKADIFLFTSFKEGFSVAMVEALAAQCVVLTTKNGSSEDIIKNGWNGFFIERDELDVAKKLQRAMDLQVSKINHLRSAAKKTASKYTMQRTVNEIARMVRAMNGQKVRNL